ncbi:hypothetical protein [Bacillus sp. 166amftsu]|uniref:hypothetical protein n=1 Tax=Bacillus sp. 166amftsu TaxID=1761753 RepID=UPI00089D22A3|nr:hypothetical protein [Bacillus sp. 166amftsu]SDZ41902.1 hypothetical protein SAMN04488156_13212 [Bacillus sp. 166amftsu]
MTLSQGIIKKCLLVFVLCFAMFFAFFPQSEASATGGLPGHAGYVYPTNIVTEDGKWDGTLYTTSTHRNVEVGYGAVALYTKSTNKFVRLELEAISFRLCNATTNACTSWTNSPKWTNMKANQKYYLDVRDKYSSYYATAGGEIYVNR